MESWELTATLIYKAKVRSNSFLFSIVFFHVEAVVAKWLMPRTSDLVVQVQAFPLGCFQEQKTVLHFVSFHLLC